MEEKFLNFRTLKADEIECRVGTVSDKGVSLLMYKDARVDMQLLDETVGAANWERSHELINGNLFCTVSVRWGDTWVRKQDVGTESNTEKEKGQASDAFKRACFNFGIGRELYTCPFVWVNLNANEWRTGANGRKQPSVRFRVDTIEYDEQRRVSHLLIKDDKGVVRYRYGVAKEDNDAKMEAIDQVKRCASREELEAIYHKYAELNNDKDFIAACQEQTAKFPKTA